MPHTMRRLTVGCLVAALFVPVAPAATAQDVSGLVQQALENPEFEWNSIRSDEVILFYQPGTFTGRHRLAHLRSAEIAISEVLEFMDEPEYARLLHVFYVGSRGEMEKLVGQPYTGFATWTASGIFLVCNPELVPFYKKLGWKLLPPPIYFNQPDGKIKSPLEVMYLKTSSKEWNNEVNYFESFPW